MTLYHVALLVDIHRKLHCRMRAFPTTFGIALFNVRLVTRYMSIFIFAGNDGTRVVKYTSFKIGTTTVCCYMILRSN